MELKREIFTSKDGVQIEGFIYQPPTEKSAKGIVLSIGGSGFSRGGFGGPSAFSKYAQSNGFIAFEWNKRGVWSNSSLTEITVSRSEYDSTTIDILVDDADSALSYISSKFPNLPVFAFGGSEGSYVTTLLAQRRQNEISGVAIFGSGIAPFIEVIEHQIAGQFLATFCKEKNLSFDHQFDLEDFQAIVKANEDFAPIELSLFSSGDGRSKKFSAAEIKSKVTEYWLLNIPNRDEYWFNASASPKNFFESMVKVPSLFERADKSSIPTLILHGTIDDMSPIQYVYQLQTVCKLRKLDNYFFEFYQDVGHAPNQEMIANGLSFFKKLLTE